MVRTVILCSLSLVFSTFLNARQGLITTDTGVRSSIHLLETWVAAQMAYRDLPGMSVGIVYDQELIYARGFGYADREKKVPAAPNTVYRIASITKTFTATALMQLRDAGKLRLDDPVEQYLPWFKYRERFPDAPKVTVRHLLTHTSGLPREAAFPYWTDHVFPTREEMIRELEGQENIFASETQYKYSNLALAIAGEVVSAVSGMPYDRYVQSNILDPLGMAATSVYLTDSQKKTFAVGYGRRLDGGKRNRSPFTDSKAITPAANMSSTVEDLARYASLQFRDGPAGGARILKGSTLREMHRVHWLLPSWKSGRGIGFGVWRWDEKTVVGHGGWVAGYRTQLACVPEEKIAVIVMTNADDGEPGYFAERIYSLLAPAIRKAVTPPPAAAVPDPGWAKFLGRYEDTSWFDSEVMIVDGKLVIYDFSYPPENNPRGNLVELTPEGPDVFRMTGENGNGELVTFELDDKGKVKRMKVGENYVTPKH